MTLPVLSAPSAKLGEDGRLHVGVTVANEDERPWYVVVGVRRIHYDQGRRTLHIFFSDRQAPPIERLPGFAHASLPDTRVVGSGEETRAEGRIARRRIRLRREDKQVRCETVSNEQAERLRLHVAVSDRPFYFVTSDPDLQRQLAQWGEDLTVDVSLLPDSARNDA